MKCIKKLSSFWKSTTKVEKKSPKKFKILQNEAECKACGDRIYSAHRHDFKTCSCGKISVDGGMNYIRRIGKEENIKDLSIFVTEDTYNALERGLDWCEETGRNRLGTICNIMRTLRDEGYNV